ncbi:ureidoglycolate lyase [Sinobacterium caligoides]|uniref:Ureidoglycolate lyase n=1 Tax=Sinobacterium caligoides TaxID=933926 RepID=A0A3N2E0J9_9GAMM|nr:ureidoglycolate lyase [Sinobacterium caligoides]ROS05641.1 ureidoglycolate lyase [Sinobacterium caligoides]
MSDTVTTKTLTPRPLTPEAFAPYGDVISIDTAEKVLNINYGNTERYHNLAQVDVAADDGQPLINIFRSRPLPTPIDIKIMERHPLSSQAFIALSGEPFVVVVGKAGEFDENALEAFIAQPGQGVNYHKGTWHHYCLALNKQCDFLVVDRGGEGNNCDEETVQQSIQVAITADARGSNI